METTKKVRLAIFASGGGSNAKKLLEHFQDSAWVDVVLIATNNPDSGVYAFAPEFGITVELMKPEVYQEGRNLMALLDHYQVDLIVLAGYLKKIPETVVRHFPQRIINIHPSLLPLYGGKGMYGMRVHEAVLQAGEKFSGISIHFVNEIYDDGKIIFQKEVAIAPDWTPKDLQQAVQSLEHTYYPKITEKICQLVHSQKNSL